MGVSLTHWLTLGCGYSAGHAAQRLRMKQTWAEDAPRVPRPASGMLLTRCCLLSTYQAHQALCQEPNQTQSTKPRLETLGQTGGQGEAVWGLDFTSTLNQNVKQIIHLLARGTIFLWGKIIKR